MFTIKQTQSNYDQRGFTLIEICISMMIIGLLIIPFVSIYNLNLKQERIRTTDQNVQRAATFLQTYRDANGEYPCPASVNVGTDGTVPAGVEPFSGNPGYGRAVDCRAAASPYNPANLVEGNCINGICMERAIAARVPSLTDSHVIVGALPFRDLQLDEDTAIDAYGNRLMYAVTYSMTDRSTLDDTQGAIAVDGWDGESRVTPEGSADFVIFSPGRTGQGAYNREGALVNPCLDGSTEDSENCNVGFEIGVAPRVESIYVAALRSEAQGFNFFDDVVEYAAKDIIEPWKRTDADPENIESLAPEDMGLGTAAPADKLTISSIATGEPSLRVSGPAGNDGIIITDQVCDDSGNCFTPQNIGGDNSANPADEVTAGPGMRCPAGELMVGIQNGVAICEPNTDLEVRCPDDAFPVLIGFNADGSPNCVAVPGASCPAQAQVLCLGHPTTPNTPVLPMSGDGSVTGYQNAGDCRRQRYRCNAGTWQTFGGALGTCTDSVGATSNPLCTSRTGYGPGPLTNYTITSTTTCTTGTNTLLRDCTCIGVPPEPRNCAPCRSGETLRPPLTAVPTYQRHRTCRADNTLRWWTTVSGTECPPRSTYCECTTAPDGRTTRERSLSCPRNQVHISGDPLRQPQRWDVATCRWVDDGAPIGGCMCDPDPHVEIENITCPDCDETPVSGRRFYARDASCNPDYSAEITALYEPARCDPYPHFWREQGVSTADVTLIPFDINAPCACSTYPPAASVNCKSPSNTAHTCNCLP